MTILRIEGDIIIKVDAIDIEQTRLEHPRFCNNFPTSIVAITAALLKDDVMAFSRAINKAKYVLHYKKDEKIEDDWVVTFRIVAMLPNEEERLPEDHMAGKIMMVKD